MRFSIKDPTDYKPLLLNAIPTTYEGAKALKVIFPERDSITMVKRNNVWTNATETDLRVELLKAISQGIQSHIEPYKVPQKQTKFKITTIKNMFPLLLIMAGIALAGCGASDKNKDVDSLPTCTSG